MLKNVLPEQAGISSKEVLRFMKALVKRNFPLHSVLLMRGEDVFLEAYWAPFHKDRAHRMYSVTKSFVSVAVGLAEEDGLINLDRSMASYFPEKIHQQIAPELQNQTVREMLTMTTTGMSRNWFVAEAMDRTQLYFEPREKYRPAGTSWQYDSTGSQVLCALVEKVTGKKLLAYMKERIFDHMGAFKNARMLKIGNGDSWGDSAMICTTRDLAQFARFVMNYGTYDGKRLMNAQYLQKATSRVVDNSVYGLGRPYAQGYGYQFWRTQNNGFAMIGMGGQVAICLPDQDLIMVCTADLQGNVYARDYIVAQFLDIIGDSVCDGPIPVDDQANKELAALTSSLELYAVTGQEDSSFRPLINGVQYVCQENPLGWKRFSVCFDGAQSGVLVYQKDTGEKRLPFYVNKNRFGKFPEEGYSGEFGAQKTTDGSKYDDAVSFAWVQENKIQLYVQIIDDYFGNVLLYISFKDDKAVVTAVKNAEQFMKDYNGEAVAQKA